VVATIRSGDSDGTRHARTDEGERVAITTAVDDPVASVATLTDPIRSECLDIDSTRALPSAVVAALRKADVFRLLAPSETGGAEIDPVTFLRVVEEASYAEGAVGWCVLIGGCYSAFGGMLPAAGAGRIFGSPDAISAGAFRPVGRAVEVDGGYRVSGRWTLGSGSRHANWFLGGCVVIREGEPVIGSAGPLLREAFFPAEAVEVIDTWHSTGLRGTSSNDYAVDDVFVPSEHTMWFQEPPTVDRPLYHMPPIAMFTAFIGAVPLGIARHAIDEFAGLAVDKTPSLSSTTLAEKPAAQDRLGRASAMVAGARHYLVGTLADVWAKVEQGHPPTLGDRGDIWLAATHAAHTSLAAIEHLYTAAGASSVYAGCALDRCLRDARTAVQHIVTQEANYELAGRRRLGLPIVPSPWSLDFRNEA
jgi:alkylation response protein AidB-like acyl-CoA dehydrogenase